jgi:UDP-N-acetylmuramate--alanine ligase
MSITQIKKIHFIGVGGIGMSALARLFLHEGKIVSGSDATQSHITKALISEGVNFFPEQKAENLIIYDKPDLVVYTEAMPADHPELVIARELGIKTINYFEALGLVANEYYLIAVSGAHGKTTTTAMVIDILEEAGFDPSAVVGSLRSKTGSNYRAGKSKYMIVEACEYKRDFLHLQPDILVITNIDFEHVDYYKSLEDVQSAFHELALKVPKDGALIADTKNSNLVPVINGIETKIINYRDAFDLTLKLHQPGIHNRMNAAAAKAVAEVLGIEKEVIDSALENFAGTWRRFEYKGEVNLAPVYDDYAHHPTEINATIAGVRELYPHKKLTVVFQSHTYSRTAELFADFATALAKADRVLMLPIYAARKEETHGVSAEQLVEKINEHNTEAIFFFTHEAAAQEVKDSVGQNDVVVVMGAGDVTKVATMLVT